MNLSATERTTVTTLTLLYALRMLGLFMILPVMMLEGQSLTGATPELLGLAMGVYGLSQAILQIPAGTLSDRFGRKPIILIGLALFAIGSFVAAYSTSIYGVLLGRALQGCGAIASAIMAMLADNVREEHRMKAMASVGASIGLSFSVALIVGPWIAAIGGLPLIFLLTGILVIAGIALTYWRLPNSKQIHHRDASPNLSEVLVQFKNPALWRLNIGIFLLHAVLVAVFVAVPLELKKLDLQAVQHGWFYLPVLVAAFIAMVPFIIVAEKKQKMKSIVIIGVVLISLTLIGMTQANKIWHWAVLLFIYFWGFNLMEASLPSWLSKIAPAGSKGSAMGIYSSFQFFGAFIGGGLGGVLLRQVGLNGLLLIPAVALIFWALWLLRSPSPKQLSSTRFEITAIPTDAQILALQQLRGVYELKLIEFEHAIYMKIDPHKFERNLAIKIIQQQGE